MSAKGSSEKEIRLASVGWKAVHHLSLVTCTQKYSSFVVMEEQTTDICKPMEN